MTKSQCYKLLELQPGATDQEIRKQYKKLAMKVHPDLNPDPKAHEQFIQLSLAVELLLNPVPEETPSRTSRSTSKKTESPEEHEARMQEAKTRYEEQQKRKQAEDEAYFQSLTSGKMWKLYKWVVRLGFVIGLMMLLDTVLPQHVEQDKIEAYSKVDHNGIKYDKICGIYFQNRGGYFVEQNRSNWISSYPEAKIYSTWFFHTPIRFVVNDDFDMHSTGFDFYSYSIRWLLIVALFLPLFPYFKQYKKLSFVFLYHLSFWGIGALELFLLITEDRLVHLLSLGFF